MSKDLLPLNAEPQERAQAEAIARLSDVPLLVREAWNPQACPASLLPWLAWALSVDEWDTNWTEQEKRDVIESSLMIHRHKGTIGAVRRALLPLGYLIEVREWWQETPKGVPYTFNIVMGTGSRPVTFDLYDKAERIVLTYKNLRSHLLKLTIKADVRGKAFAAAALVDGCDTTIFPYAITDVSVAGLLYFASAMQDATTTTVYPSGGVIGSMNTKSTWGDLALKIVPAYGNLSLSEYHFTLFHPTELTRPMRTLVVDGATAVDGIVRADYPNELNVPDAVTVFGAPAPWNYLRWQVATRLKGSTQEPTVLGRYEGDVLVDNASFVKKTVIMGINSLVGGYFNDLSDTLNPGGTGVPGRKDLVAASTFRNVFAETAGLSPIEVMPVMAVVGSSPINPMPYQAGFDLNNYWWNAVTNEPGPNLVYATGIVESLGTIPDYFVESGPGETTGLAFADPADRAGILAAWRTSNIAMLAWMRANWGNPNLEIWFQGATTSWWGEGIPADVNAECTKLVRDLQQSMSLENIGFKMGSYVPSSNKYSAYLNEMAQGIGWVHYTVEGYHAAAADMALAMATNTNRALTPPAWTSLAVVTGVVGAQQINSDVKISWNARPGATAWKYRNKRADNKETISEGVVTSPQFTFTSAQQVAAYGYHTNYIVCDVQEYIAATNDDGPASEFIVTADASAGLLAPTDLAAVHETNNDVTMSWTGRAGVASWYFRNLRADNGAVISEGVLSSPGTVFTSAQQVAAYGYTVSYVIFEVQEYDVASATKGPSTQFNGSAS